MQNPNKPNLPSGTAHTTPASLPWLQSPEIYFLLRHSSREFSLPWQPRRSKWKRPEPGPKYECRSAVPISLFAGDRVINECSYCIFINKECLAVHEWSLHLIPESQLSTDDTGISVSQVGVTHCSPMAIQVHLETATLIGRTSYQPCCTWTGEYILSDLKHWTS